MTLRARRLAALAALACLPLGMQAADDVIYPRNPAAASQPAETSRGGMNLITGLLAAACAGGAGWFYWRQRRLGGAVGFSRTERKLAIAETRSLGNRQHLVVADYEGKKFLLGVCPGRIDLLTPLNDGNTPAKSS